jgi:hypothetical protein
MSKAKPIIRNIYLYLVTLIGLIMIVIPSVDLIKIGLETWVFPLAAEDEYYNNRIPEPYGIRNKIDINSTEPTETIKLTEEEQILLEEWKTEYKAWQENEKNKDWKAIRRQQSTVRDISTLLVGLALFLSHGRIVRKEKNNKK